MVQIEDVAYVVDENLLRLSNGMVAVRRDTARFSRPPIDDLLPRGIADVDSIPVVGDRGWVMITNDRHLRTRPDEATLAIAHRLKVVHLFGDIGNSPAWDQLIRVATRWPDNAAQHAKPGPWWLSLRSGSSRGGEPESTPQGGCQSARPLPSGRAHIRPTVTGTSREPL